MPTSEIGTTISSNSSSSSTAGARSPNRMRTFRHPAGFTLIEMLVVVFIIGIIAAGVLLSVSITGTDHELQTESERLATLMNYARDEAEMQTRELGLACSASGYEFYAFDPRTALWGSIQEDDALRARTLPAGLTLKLNVEGHDIVFKPPNKTDPKKPDVMIFSNGDLSAFELTVVRDGATRSVKLALDDKGHIATTASPEKPT
jgi:general secretion pathway protein H